MHRLVFDCHKRFDSIPPKKMREIDSLHFTSCLVWTFLNFLAG